MSVSLAFALNGAETLLIKQDFENQISGSVPTGWSRAWGNQGDDLFRVSSEYAVSGQQSMLFDRLSGENKAQWGLCTRFPHITAGTYKLSFNFMVFGPGNQASFTFEFRNRDGREKIFRITFKDRNILLGSYAPLPRKKQTELLGRYEPAKWYNMTLKFPANSGAGKYVEATLLPLESPEHTKTVKHLINFPKGKFGMLMLCIGPNKRGYRLFIDDFQVSAVNNSTINNKIIKDKKMKKTAAVILAASTVCAGANGVDQKLKNFMAKSQKQRIAVIALGDSNQQFGGHGWNQYMSEAILKQFGAYGTGLIQVAARVPSWVKAKGSINEGAPNELAPDLFSYWYLPAGERQKANWNITGYGIAADHPMDIRGELQYRIKYAVFKDGKGLFRPSVRINKAPWKIFQTDKPVSTGGEKNATSEYIMTVKADPQRTYPILFSISPINGMIDGPFLSEFCAIENAGKQTGCSYQTLYAAGGHALRDMLLNLRKTGDGKIVSFMKFIRESLNGDKSCVVMINSGLNDRNRGVKSSGPEKKALANTKDGYKDNLKGLTILLERCWIKAGGAKETIHFAFMPSHPISTPDDPKLVSYRQGASELAKAMDNASCILLPKLVSQITMLKDKYYDKRGKAHLTRKGYQKISEAVAAAIAK